jgi:hypothetical protein
MLSTDPAEPKIEPRSIQQLRFGWWNTSLSPAGKSRATAEEKEIAREIVRWLMDELQVDCLALGEVTQEDLEHLKDGCSKETLSVFNGTLKTGRLTFDTGLIYDRDRLGVADERSLATSHGNRNFKLANQLVLRVELDNSLIHVFVTHWPSRGVTEENIVSRKMLAAKIREKIEEIECADQQASIILLGDFNDEPFDESIAGMLLATRDRTLACAKSGYLYNPFWRHVGESEPHSHEGTQIGVCGSYFHRSGNETQWRTFDQILFSRSFLSGRNWHLNERMTMIVQSEQLVGLVKSNGNFDHLPVLGVIERSMKGIGL